MNKIFEISRMRSITIDDIPTLGICITTEIDYDDYKAPTKRFIMEFTFDDDKKIMKITEPDEPNSKLEFTSSSISFPNKVEDFRDKEIQEQLILGMASVALIKFASYFDIPTKDVYKIFSCSQFRSFMYASKEFANKEKSITE